MFRTGRCPLPWCGASVTASIAVAIVAGSTWLSAPLTASVQTTPPSGLIAHYPLAGSLFDATRTHAPLIVSHAPFHADRGIFCSGEYALDWPEGCDVRACRSSEGSRNLSPFKRRVYNTMLLMQQLEFDRPLPWTTAPLYRWLTSTIRGIRFRRDIVNPFCCSPERVINLKTGTADAIPSDRWMDPALGAALGVHWLMPVIVHEARHADGYPHTCGSNDRSIEELGGWGVHYHLLRWLGEHTDQAFFSAGPRNYNARLKGKADAILENHMCGP